MKICSIIDTPSLYRESIHKKIDETFDCDWYFGDYDYKVKTYNHKELKRVSILHVIKPFGSTVNLYYTKGLVDLLKNKNYSIYFIVGEPRNMALWFLVLIKRLLYKKKKIFFWCHGWYGKESAIEALIKKYVYGSASGIFTYGEYAKRLMIENGFNSTIIHPIHNSLDYDKQFELRKKIDSSDVFIRHFNNSFPTIIFIGRLTEIKRLDMIIDALKLLKEKGELYNLVLVGEGPMKESLVLQTQNNHLTKRVWFYGACYDEVQNAELIYNSDLCVAPGNVGLTAMHSMMFGTPVISHNSFMWQMPEFEAIKPGVTGDFFDYGNTESLAESISRWFTDNKRKRQQIRDNCFAEIDNYWNPYFQIEVLKTFLK